MVGEVWKPERAHHGVERPVIVRQVFRCRSNRAAGQLALAIFSIDSDRSTPVTSALGVSAAATSA
jgi:hypothetical protein